MKVSNKNLKEIGAAKITALLQRDIILGYVPLILYMDKKKQRQSPKAPS